MPELPEVESVRAEVSAWFSGRTITGVHFDDAKPGPKYRHIDVLRGATVLAVKRRGKFLICPLSNGHDLVVHLGMTGVIMRSRPEQHLRVYLTLDNDETLYFRDTRRFGRFAVAKDGDYSLWPTLFHMGPEPLSADFTVARFKQGLQSRVAIKTRLLSQRPVAGVGNIYADEALWLSGIRPDKPSNSLSKPRIKRLRDNIVQVLDSAVQNGGTTIRDFQTGDGEVGRYGLQLKAYGRGGAPCYTCGTPLLRTVIAQRTTVWCRRCQT